MVVNFEFKATGNCTLEIKDITTYKESDPLDLTGYVQDSVYIINILKYIDGEDDSIQEYKITKPSESVTFSFGKDGLYEIDHLVLPNSTYVEKNAGTLSGKGDFYYTDGKVIYRYGNSESVDIKILSEGNLGGVFKTYKNTFSLCNLRECYYNISKKILNEICPLNCSKDQYSEDIFNRDLIWMALNVIQYCLEKGDYSRALSFLKQIEGCGTICSQATTTKQKSDCGCSR